MNLSAFLGQDVVKAKVRFQIELAKKQRAALNHMLLCGSDGEGKAFLAKCIAAEMQVSIKTTEGSVIERSGDLAAILTN